jgi:hypothetical protein
MHFEERREPQDYDGPVLATSSNAICDGCVCAAFEHVMDHWGRRWRLAFAVFEVIAWVGRRTARPSH